MGERTAEDLQRENQNLRCFLWLAAQQCGGKLVIPKAALEAFEPSVSQAEFWIDLETGDYCVEARYATGEPN